MLSKPAWMQRYRCQCQTKACLCTDTNNNLDWPETRRWAGASRVQLPMRARARRGRVGVQKGSRSPTSAFGKQHGRNGAPFGRNEAARAWGG